MATSPSGRRRALGVGRPRRLVRWLQVTATHLPRPARPRTHPERVGDITVLLSRAARVLDLVCSDCRGCHLPVPATHVEVAGGHVGGGTGEDGDGVVAG